MNLVKRWFSELTTKQLQGGAHTSVAGLKESIDAWTDHWHQNPRPFVWHTVAEVEEILETMAVYLQRIPQNGR